MTRNGFVFNAVLLRERRGYSALCLDLDVASCGATPAQAKRSLLEAVTLYLETAFEQNLPYLRPVPPVENPLLTRDPAVVEPFRVRVQFSIAAHV